MQLPHRIHSLCSREFILTICSTGRLIGQLLVQRWQPVHSEGTASRRSAGHEKRFRRARPRIMNGAITVIRAIHGIQMAHLIQSNRSPREGLPLTSKSISCKPAPGHPQAHHSRQRIPAQGEFHFIFANLPIQLFLNP